MAAVRRIAILGGALLLVALMSMPARAQYGSAVEPGIAATNRGGALATTYSPGDSVRIVCTAPAGVRCADAGALVRFLFVCPGHATVEMGRMFADANGRFDSDQLGLTIPRNGCLGPATLVAATTLNGQPVEYSQAITIVAAAGATRLPTTGRDIAEMTIAGLAMFAVGSMLATAMRRRRHGPELRVALTRR